MTDDNLELAARFLKSAEVEGQRQALALDLTPGDNIFTIPQLIEHSKAFALIAIAEAMQPRLVQVGPVVFDPGDIKALDDVDGHLSIYFKAVQY